MMGRGGLIGERDSAYTTVRLRIPAGIVYSSQLSAIQDAADRFGDGRIHLSTRQTLEIPHVRREKAQEVLDFLAQAGWYQQDLSGNIRNVVACPGTSSCPNALIDAQALALEIDSLLTECADVPGKVKVGVSGCANGCGHSLLCDLGVVGRAEIAFDPSLCRRCHRCVREACRTGALQVQGGSESVRLDPALCEGCGLCVPACHAGALAVNRVIWQVWVAGKLGRSPRFGLELARLASPAAVLDLAGALLALWKAKGQAGERLGDFVRRLGLGGIRHALGLPSSGRLAAQPLPRNREATMRLA
ncbi:MAG: 4Fe-4S binding protein [Firmicutes bacterium]|nr:4Fe-4S binding protein [Bacillota bacterium]